MNGPEIEKVDAPKGKTDLRVRNVTVERAKTGRSKRVKVKGQKDSKWTVPRVTVKRSKRLKVDSQILSILMQDVVIELNI